MNKDNATFSEYEQNKGSFQKVYAKKIWNFPYVKRGKVREALKKKRRSIWKIPCVRGGGFQGGHFFLCYHERFLLHFKPF